MRHKNGISESSFKIGGSTTLCDESAIDVTDLIDKSKFPSISGSLFNLIGSGSARLEIKESQVTLFFNSIQKRREWESIYLN
ncbi:MAG: hypothetical protein HY200_05455 [Nitrospirae bacterium]|nr:hypothetical protein [Nitrospirota bacterium]MBI3594387.1 hypothetical protein [Nitrospirota bacterium]